MDTTESNAEAAPCAEDLAQLERDVNAMLEPLTPEQRRNAASAMHRLLEERLGLACPPWCVGGHVPAELERGGYVHESADVTVALPGPRFDRSDDVVRARLTQYVGEGDRQVGSTYVELESDGPVVRLLPGEAAAVATLLTSAVARA